METTTVKKLCSCTITFEDIPETVDLDATIERFGKHRYHMGACVNDPVENNLTPDNKLPPVESTSHVVREVSLNDDGGLDIEVEIINSPSGFTLSKQYDTENFKMVPVMDENLINIYRFDFVKEE